MKKVVGKIYTRNDFYWAVMYKRRITAIYPRESDARTTVFKSNLTWQKNGWKKDWSVKRFRYYFRGSEIDAYEHEYRRKEK